MLNRSVILVRPKQSYLDWAMSLDDSGLEPRVEGEKTIYLIPEYGNDGEAKAILGEVYEIIFQEELQAWHTVAADWPTDRNLTMFLDWFEVEFHSVVEDLCGFPLKDDSE